MAGVRRHGISAVLPDKEPVPGTMSTAIAMHGTRGALTGKGLSAWAFLKRPSQPLGFGTEPPCVTLLEVLEVRLLGFRHVRVLVVVILVRIFGADSLRYLVGPRHISQRRAPGRREDAFILDRHMQLEELAAVLAEDITVKEPILSSVPVECVFHVVIIAQPIAFHDV